MKLQEFISEISISTFRTCPFHERYELIESIKGTFEFADPERVREFIGFLEQGKSLRLAVWTLLDAAQVWAGVYQDSEYFIAQSESDVQLKNFRIMESYRSLAREFVRVSLSRYKVKCQIC